MALKKACLVLSVGAAVVCTAGHNAAQQCGQPDSIVSHVCREVPSSDLKPKVLVMSLVLPDGMGDIIFGECASRELMLAPLTVTWLRAYPSETSRDQGEALVSDTASAKVANSFVFTTPQALAAELDSGALDDLWSSAQEVFLAPWYFGIYAHDAPLLALAERLQHPFWALTEYGRGMGNIQKYTGGLGRRVPTGWPVLGGGSVQDGYHGGVFKTILHDVHTGTDWKNHFAKLIGHRSPAPKLVRLWWAYSRLDSARIHTFRLARPTLEQSGRSSGAAVLWPKVVKVVPVAENGGLAFGDAKTTGEVLAEQATALLHDSESQLRNTAPETDVLVQSETESHVAGQMSELLVHILSQDAGEAGTAEVVVAPNLGISSWAGESIVQVTQMELIWPRGEKRQMLNLGRPVFLVEASVPRMEMRAFLDQCENALVATGDQSVAEAVLLGKVPLARPDAKVRQWELALKAMEAGAVDEVADLGGVLRRLVNASEERDRATAWSEQLSLEAEARAKAQASPAMAQIQESLARAGMFG
mmetsp:Transcript_15605/g.33160  ORF Transcript_15605/g.33160 Transcript_15605/m.33160 type:complete len:531 (-) Transcript_15605:44-1636(-)